MVSTGLRWHLALGTLALRNWAHRFSPLLGFWQGTLGMERALIMRLHPDAAHLLQYALMARAPLHRPCPGLISWKSDSCLFPFTVRWLWLLVIGRTVRFEYVVVGAFFCPRTTVGQVAGLIHLFLHTPSILVFSIIEAPWTAWKFPNGQRWGPG